MYISKLIIDGLRGLKHAKINYVACSRARKRLFISCPELDTSEKKTS